ncbi:MAG TPA: trigger factor [Firmicutes bacterium]|nr:trigger factor [Bacillota bacterium]
MPVKWEKLDKNKVKFEIEVPSPEVDTALARAYRKVVQKVKLPGFRKGKIPRRILEMRFGPEILYDDALEILVPDAYRRAIKEADLEPIDEPEIECHQLESGKPFLFEAVVEVMPEVVLGQYKGVEVEQEEVEVTAEHVDKFLEGLREQHARLVTVPEGEGAAGKGDMVIIDFKGFIDGQPFEGGEAENYSLELGSQSFIGDFEEQLEGAIPGEQREVSVKFPDNYMRDELAGKQALFEVTVNEIKRKQLPELNDEFGKEIGDFENLEELKADIRQRLEKTAQEQSERKLEDDLIRKISESAQVELPELLVERQVDRMMNDLEQYLRYQGLTLDKYAEFADKTVEEIRQEKRPEAELRARSAVVLEAIVKEEGIAVEDHELDRKIEEIARTYSDEPERVKELFKKQGRLQLLEEEIKLKKAINLLLSEAQVSTVKPSTE